MTTPSFFATVDGLEFEAALHFVIASATGPWTAPLATLAEQALYKRSGVTLLDDEPTIPAGDIVLSGTILGSDRGDFETKLLALLRRLGSRGRQDHVLVFGNQTARQFTARYMGYAQGPVSPQMISSKIPIDLHFRWLQGTAVDTTDQTISGAAATPVAIPLGLEPCYGTMSTTLSASASSITFTYKDYNGTVLGSLTVTHAFVSGDVIAADNDAQTITVNGARHDVYLSNGDFIRFDPAHGDPTVAHWPTIEVDHGALSATYRRRW